MCLCAALAASALVATAACSSSPRADSPPSSTAPSGDGGSDVDELPLPPLDGALEGLEGLRRPPPGPVLERLRRAADDALEVAPSAREPLRIEDTEDPFVGDAQRAWTLALAYRFTRDDAYATAATAIVDDWVTTTETLEDACPDSGGCHTSLMVSRAAPGLVFGAEGRWDEDRTEDLHAWLRDLILPAASDRDGNWGDAGTFLRVAVAAELGDTHELERAADRWRQRIDLIGADGQIPEEVRREDAGLMYSQEALGYKVATADILGRAGIDVWDEVGDRGGSLRGALDLVVASLDEPDRWPVTTEDLRIPRPGALWPIVADRWDESDYASLADAARGGDGSGHSAVLWTSVTHPG
jgi:hypothetical protein